MKDPKTFINASVNHFYNKFKHEMKEEYKSFNIRLTKDSKQKLTYDDFTKSVVGNHPTIFILIEDNNHHHHVFASYGSLNQIKYNDIRYLQDDEFFVSQLMYDDKLDKPFKIKSNYDDAYDTCCFREKEMDYIIGIGSLFSLHHNMTLKFDKDSIKDLHKDFEFDENDFETVDTIFKTPVKIKGTGYKIIQIVIGDWE